MRNARLIRCRRRAILALAALGAGAALAAVGAAAAGTFAARAQAPSYDSSALELTGRGAYTTARGHAELRVTVCLQKRLAGRAFPVRCQTATGAGKRVSAEVAVPGCVKGTWRTTATGEALGPQGEWVHRASATSAPFRC
ncbi:MAG: hypothetical protein JSS68_02040 [Actinobacteria bacterium]|nr:hypothetical protein [Actinomycetota bacterium]